MSKNDKRLDIIIFSREMALPLYFLKYSFSQAQNAQSGSLRDVKQNEKKNEPEWMKIRRLQGGFINEENQQKFHQKVWGIEYLVRVDVIDGEEARGNQNELQEGKENGFVSWKSGF